MLRDNGLKSTLKRYKPNTTPVENRIFSSENATICTVPVLADVVVRLLVPAGPLVPGPNNPIAQFNPHLTFSVKIEF